MDRYARNDLHPLVQEFVWGEITERAKHGTHAAAGRILLSTLVFIVMWTLFFDDFVHVLLIYVETSHAVVDTTLSELQER